LLIIALITLLAPSAHAENIDPDNDGSQYAWGENLGWINFEPSYGSGITVTNSAVSGYAWGENIGWIKLDPVFGGVVNDGNGNLSGYAWGENVGWINFDPTGGGVSINACGEFDGYAWGENIGWISFNLAYGGVMTSWVSPIDTVPPVTLPDNPVQSWYTSGLGFGLTATDCGHGVQEIRYRIDGGAEVVTSGSAASANITTDGCHTLTFYALDMDGNIESSNSETICIDKTPPVITIISPADSVTYYLNATVTADFTVTDATSDVAVMTSTLPDGSPVDTKTTGQHTFTVSATDNAGNTRTVTNTYSVSFAGNIDPQNNGSHYAWGENVGWINLKPAWGDGVTVTDASVTGYAWGENIGWINLNPANGGVVNDGNGNLSGYAWGENVGWIHFNPTGGGVTVSPSTGAFSGYAWGENIGWINFAPANGGTKTSWRGDYDGDGFKADIDCNDSNPSINPLTKWYSDNDGDGYGTPAIYLQQCAQPAGYVLNNIDYDDNDPSIGPPVRISGASTNYYSSLQAAYDASTDGGIIQAVAVSIIGDLVVGRNISVTLEGGYNGNFNSQPGRTTIQGNMTITAGEITVEHLVLR